MRFSSIIILVLMFSLNSNAQEKRIALIIGNAAYQHGGVLKNSVNDAKLMAATLQDLGFTVIKKTNINL